MGGGGGGGSVCLWGVKLCVCKEGRGRLCGGGGLVVYVWIVCWGGGQVVCMNVCDCMSVCVSVCVCACSSLSDPVHLMGS